MRWFGRSSIPRDAQLVRDRGCWKTYTRPYPQSQDLPGAQAARQAEAQGGGVVDYEPRRRRQTGTDGRRPRRRGGRR